MQTNFIKELFSSIAEGYDKANFFMTLGLDEFWRKKLVHISQVKSHHKVLDCATGTGKLATLFAKEAKEVIGIDFCQEMLDLAPKNQANLNFLNADIEKLPFKEKEFDITSVAYGVRNAKNLSKAIDEMARVTKADGQVLILETGHKVPALIKPFYKLHTKLFLPLIGYIFTKNIKAYQYLEKSSQNFPCGKDFTEILKAQNHFSKIKCYKLFFGVSYIYQAFKNTNQ